MSENENTPSNVTTEASPSPSAQAWGADLTLFICERCDWIFLASASSSNNNCPHCHQGVLSPLKDASEEEATHPELVIPFNLSSSVLESAIQSFSKEIPFAPDDLSYRQLHSRLQAIYLPMWLVDANVQANWRSEVGFDYQVVSHHEQFEQNRGGWSTRQVNETKIRWEPRLGRLKRSYQNISAPALEEHLQFRSQLGAFDLSQAGPYLAQTTQNALVRLPNRSTQDAWSDAEPTFQAAAAEEVRQAAGADHLRQFSWQAQFQDQNWTLLLQPVFTTYYLDDANKPQPVLVHGQTGKTSGLRQASYKRAQRSSITLILTAGILFMVSLLAWTFSILLPPISTIGVLGMVAALLVGFGSVIPLATVWWFNKNQTGK